MVKYLTFILLILIGCEINSEQVIKPEKFTYDIIKFNTVSKELFNKHNSDSNDHKKMNDIIEYWFDNRIKTNGFNGHLTVNIKKIEIERLKEDNFYQFSISLSIEFNEDINLNNKKTYIINSKEFGDITGSFSIKDQENLDLNLMHKSLESVSLKFRENN